MRQHASLQKDDEANAAAYEAAKGAVVGAAKVTALPFLSPTQIVHSRMTPGAFPWGAATAFLGAAGYLLSPIYRGLTVQFKVFLQMSGMTIGSMIEADRRLRDYEVTVRRNKRLARDAAVWDRYEGLYEKAANAEGAGRGAERGKGDEHESR
ncbi:MAG: hypothetical protein M1830_010640 [Pleopsidium flavum]|nr:MAG: hypothetical protein M1830_010640 [Pleopsidium flavum]